MKIIYERQESLILSRFHKLQQEVHQKLLC